MQMLAFNFFGVGTRVVVPSRFDAEHFEYYFRDFLAPSITAELELQFATRPEVSFVKALTDPRVTKVTMVREGRAAWRVYDAFTRKSSAPSPIPPFEMAAFRRRYRTVHAASLVCPRTGGAVLLCGPSFAGKSVLTLELLRRGWGFLSDDMSVIERDVGRLWAFPRPLGIRERTRQKLGWLSDLLDAQMGRGTPRRIRTSSGDTVMVRVEDLFPSAKREHAPVTHIVKLDPRTDAATLNWESSSFESLDKRFVEAIGSPGLERPKVHEARYELWSHLDSLVEHIEEHMR